MQIVFHRTFKKQYKKVSPKIRANFNERLELLRTDQTNPLLRLHALKGNRKPLLSINISVDYRALFYQDATTFTFMEIGTHSELYR